MAKRIAEMSPEEMRQALLTSETTGLPNRRAFDEGTSSEFVAMGDANGLKSLNDRFGYEAGNGFIRRLAKVLIEVGLDAYHDKGDEFLCKGASFSELNGKLTEAQRRMRESFVVRSRGGRSVTVNGADFCFGIGFTLRQAEFSLRNQKELHKALDPSASR